MKAERTYHCAARASQMNRDSVLTPNSGSPRIHPAVESKLDDGRQGCVRSRVCVPRAMRHGSGPCSTVHRHGRAPLMRSGACPGRCSCASCRCAPFSSRCCFRIGLFKVWGTCGRLRTPPQTPCQSGLLIEKGTSFPAFRFRAASGSASAFSSGSSPPCPLDCHWR
jgi:hypothetical protein